MPDDDASAIARVRAGDKAAWGDIVGRNQATLERVIGRYLKSKADVADTAQDVFLRAFSSIDSFRGESPFRSWLLRIGVNTALNRLRGAPLSAPLDLVDDEAFTNSLGTDRLVASELWRKVKERIVALPPKQRAVVELRLYHELSFEEIGAIVGSTEESAKQNFHHGVKRLRGLLPSRGEVKDGSEPER